MSFLLLQNILASSLRCVKGKKQLDIYIGSTIVTAFLGIYVNRLSETIEILYCSLLIENYA